MVASVHAAFRPAYRESPADQSKEAQTATLWRALPRNPGEIQEIFRSADDKSLYN